MESLTASLRVTAEAHDDDFFYQVPSFDCAPWFEQANDDELIELARCHWGGDYPSDYVALHFEGKPGYEDVTAMFENKRTGFECHVNKEEAIVWIQANKPHLTVLLKLISKRNNPRTEVGSNGLPVIGTFILDRTASETGKVISYKDCTLTGCRGIRLGVRWENKKLTWPCSKGMKVTETGTWQII